MSLPGLWPEQSQPPPEGAASLQRYRGLAVTHRLRQLLAARSDDGLVSSQHRWPARLPVVPDQVVNVQNGALHQQCELNVESNTGPSRPMLDSLSYQSLHPYCVERLTRSYSTYSNSIGFCSKSSTHLAAASSSASCGVFCSESAREAASPTEMNISSHWGTPGAKGLPASRTLA
jgi:hypothetical protein